MIYNNIHLTLESFWGDSASGIVPICPTTKRICLGLRSEWVLEPNTWGNFGGAIGLGHGGELEEKLTPKDNAIKELIEETGYMGEIKIIPSYIFKKGNFTYYNFIGVVEHEFDIDKTGMEHVEVDEIAWFTLDDALSLPNLHFGVKELLENNYNQIYNLLFK